MPNQDESFWPLDTVVEQFEEGLKQLREARRFLATRAAQEQIEVHRGSWEALIALYNSVFGMPWSLDVRRTYPAIDRAVIRVWYEMCCANGAQLKPFEQHLVEETDFYHMHPEQRPPQEEDAAAQPHQEEAPHAEP